MELLNEWAALIIVFIIAGMLTCPFTNDIIVADAVRSFAVMLQTGTAYVRLRL